MQSNQPGGADSSLLSVNKRSAWPPGLSQPRVSHLSQALTLMMAAQTCAGVSPGNGPLLGAHGPGLWSVSPVRKGRQVDGTLPIGGNPTVGAGEAFHSQTRTNKQILKRLKRQITLLLLCWSRKKRTCHPGSSSFPPACFLVGSSSVSRQRRFVIVCWFLRFVQRLFGSHPCGEL